jgi:hypothetical protein
VSPLQVRTGENEKKINVQRVAALLAHTGAAALTVHGRTMEQRWELEHWNCGSNHTDINCWDRHTVCLLMCSWRSSWLGLRVLLSTSNSF